MTGTIIDVKGIKVGQASDKKAMTGCTVILCENGAVAGVDVRGGAPGTRETSLLNPLNLVEKVYAVLLAGGSAFGLDAACGVMAYLEENGCGFDVGMTKVPIVPGAVLFDLAAGDYRVRPNKEMGYLACQLASADKVEEGCVGAGTGATVGKALGMEYATKSGVGSSSIYTGNLVVGAIVAVNAFGEVVESSSGRIIAGIRNPQGTGFIPTLEAMKTYNNRSNNLFIQNTTIGLVATNARLSKAQANKVAQMAHNGLALTIRPVHTMFDGDTIFSLSTGEIDADVNFVGSLAVEAVARAVIRAVENATSLGAFPAGKDILQSC